MLNYMLEKIKENLKFPSNYGLIESVIPELSIFYAKDSMMQVSKIQQPSICLILQGEHHIQVGDQQYHCKAGDFVCYSVEMPVVQFIEGSADTLYIDFRAPLDMLLMQEIMQEMSASGHIFPKFCEMNLVSQITPHQANATNALIDVILSEPQDIAILAKPLLKVIYYYVLKSEQGGLLRSLLKKDSNIARISQAIGKIRDQFAEPLNIENLAMETGMSQSSFHTKFRQITGMSPLQYQKNLRLTKAHHLIQNTQANVSTAAYQVGYESLPQFSREYKRYFGHSPSSQK